MGLRENLIRFLGRSPHEPYTGRLEWEDDLIWCPSQCTAKVMWPDGRPAFLYLRWRWDDPWTASIITVPPGQERVTGNPRTEQWRDVEIPYFTDQELDLAKAALEAEWVKIRRRGRR